MHFQLPSKGAVRRLGHVPSTLLIPLAARAHGAKLFPDWDPHDRCAAAQLQRCGVQVQDLRQDPCTVLNVLWRTRLIQQWGRQFFERHPRSTGVNLGAGLAQHFQWLDNGHNRWIDADLPEVLALRQGCQEGLPARVRQQALDLRLPGWWSALPLGRHRQAPWLVLLEGVLMYFHPQQVRAVLAELAEHAPPGTEVLCDFISPWGVGCAGLNPSMAATHAQFRSGARHAQDLADMHPRLRVLGQCSVAQAYGQVGSWLEMCCAPWAGGPMYAMAHLQVGAA